MYNHGLTETNFNINEFKKDEIDFFTLHFKTKDCFDTRNMRLNSAYKKWSIALTRSISDEGMRGSWELCNLLKCSMSARLLKTLVVNTKKVSS